MPVQDERLIRNSTFLDASARRTGHTIGKSIQREMTEITGAPGALKALQHLRCTCGR